MRFSWCVCDLDGTLLDGTGAVSRKDQQALRRLAGEGVPLILATGRTDLMVARYALELGVEMPVIACNGGLIRDVRSREVLYVKTMEPALAEGLCRHFLAEERDFLIYTLDSVYYAPGSRRVERFERYNALAEPALRVPLLPVEQWERDRVAQPAIKFLLADVSEGWTSELERAFNGRGELTIISSEHGVLDIMASSTSKGGALEILARARGLDLKRTIVFGDNYNDLSMFELCGLPIAMANAEEAVKRAAAYVTLSNEASGVGEAIERLLQGGGRLTSSLEAGEA